VNHTDPTGRFSLAEIGISNAISNILDSVEAIGKRLAGYSEVEGVKFLLGAGYFFGLAASAVVTYFYEGWKVGQQIFKFKSDDFFIKSADIYYTRQGSDNILDIGFQLQSFSTDNASIKGGGSLDITDFSKSKLLQLGGNLEVAKKLGKIEIAKFAISTRGSFPLSFKVSFEASFLQALKFSLSAIDYSRSKSKYAFKLFGITL
jgi:hypothetical protein